MADAYLTIFHQNLDLLPLWVLDEASRNRICQKNMTWCVSLVTVAQDVVCLITEIGTENAIKSTVTVTAFIFTVIYNCILNTELSSPANKKIFYPMCPLYLTIYFIPWCLNLIFPMVRTFQVFYRQLQNLQLKMHYYGIFFTSCFLCNINRVTRVLPCINHHFFHAVYQTILEFSSHFTKALQQSLVDWRFQVSAVFHLYLVLPVMVLSIHGKNQ
jgi:hypothetical protein